MTGQRINGEITPPIEETWERHYRSAEKLYRDAEYLMHAQPQRTEVITETLARAQFHATMAVCKVEQPQIDQWAQVDRDWWEQHPRQVAAETDHARGHHVHLTVGGEADSQVAAEFRAMEIREGLA